jgi:hypothetical protein
MPEISNTQRAFWMVLITSLATPLFAALIEVALTLASPLFDFALPQHDAAPFGEVALRAFAWSALPATIAALGLIPLVLEKGTFGWLSAAVAGVLAFGVSTIIAPFAAGPSMPFLAFLAGLIAIGMRFMLIQGRILKP